MILKHLKQTIIAQITVLIVFVLVGLAGLKICSVLLAQRENYLQGLVNNEQVKVEISHVLQKKLHEMNVRIHDLANVNSVSEMTRMLKLFEQLRDDVDQTLAILHEGGAWVESYPVNFGGVEIITRRFNYVNHQKQKIDLQLIELRSKLSDLDEIVEEFSALIKLKIEAFEKRDALLVAEIINKVSQYYKGVEPFFIRILENSYRLHFESQQEMQRIHSRHAGFVRQFNSIENISGIAMAALILLLGSFVLRSSRRILDERDSYQQELIVANENLERKVQYRTLELEREVAEREQAERHVTEQAEFLLNIIESLDHPFYVINAENYKIVLANSAAGATANIDAMTCHKLTHQQQTPCSGQDHPCPLKIVKETGKPIVLEHIHTNLRDEIINVEVHGYPVFDSAGRLVQMIEYTLDITDKKKAETALLQANEQLEDKVRERTSELEEQILQRKKAQLTLIKSERHFRRLIENISDIITIVDTAGLIKYTSPSVETVLGFSPADVIGKDIRSLIKTEDMKHLDMNQLYDKYGEKNLMMYRVITPDGSYRVLESFIKKFEQEGGSDGYILNSRDVTARMLAEEETHKLRLVIEQSPDSIVITDTAGRIEFVNSAFEEITGYSASEVIGKNPRILKSGKTPEARFSQLWQVITQGKVWQGEFVNRKKNGEHYEENVLVVPIKNLRGEITNYAAVKENISELRRAQKQAVSANQAKSIFLSRMSHELRTPLNAINGFSQLMLKSKKHPLTEKQRNMTEQIASAGDHLLQLINEVLDLARIESGEFSLSLEPVDPHQVLSACLSLSKPLAEKKAIELIDHCTDRNVPLIRADLTRTKQVLLNLLSNAVKYNNQGGRVEVSIKSENDGFLRFIVSDNGFGIAEEKQSDVFVPFTRMVDNPDTVEGTGIGMTITKQLVERMGGQIGFESRLGVGSRFWFMLPLCRRQNQLDEAQSTSEHTVEIENNDNEKRSSKRILYIEDNPTNVDFMLEAIDDIGGYAMETADSGESGLEAAKKNIPDLLLLDLNLPGIDGFQVYRQLKADPATEYIPVVAVSADAMETTVKKINKLGFDGYLSKPVDIDLLKKTLTDVLEIG